MNDENRWYFILDSEAGRRQEGPVSGEDLGEMLSVGKISPDTLVWHDGMSDWAQIGTVTEFSQPTREEASPSFPDSETPETSNSDPSVDEAEADAPADLVTIKDAGNYSIQFSKSRSVLLITANDDQAEPLVLTKLDLLGFLTAMEASATEV